MNTAIIAQTLKSFPGGGSERDWIENCWRRLCSIFTSREKTEKLARLIAQYRTVPVEIRAAAENEEAVEMIESVRKRAVRRQPTWGELDAVERALLSILPWEELKCRAWTLREEFLRAASAVPADQALARAYQKSDPPEVDVKRETGLRADLLELLDQLHGLRNNRRKQIRARNAIACWTVGFSALAIYVTLQLDKLLHIEDTIVFDVFGIGMLGGVFSTLRRIQNFKLGGSYETAALTQIGNQLCVVLAPLIGGFGALVLFIMLAAGVLKGTFFPDLPAVQFNYFADALEDLFKLHIASSTEAAKLYLLCFLAGFSERLVPDVMSRLAARAEDGKARVGEEMGG
jgi:hypothetical protein